MVGTPADPWEMEIRLGEVRLGYIHIQSIILHHKRAAVYPFVEEWNWLFPILQVAKEKRIFKT